VIRSRALALSLALSAALAGNPARAQIGSSCTLSLSAPGTLTMAGTGTVLGSQESGGTAAVMLIVSSLGTHPTIVVTAPSVVGPPGWAGTPITYVSYSTLSGAVQPYTSAQSTKPVGLIDTVTLNARVLNTSGFRAGSYTVTTTVTCQL
jgi:hypothetical protein